MTGSYIRVRLRVSMHALTVRLVRREVAFEVTAADLMARLIRQSLGIGMDMAEVRDTAYTRVIHRAAATALPGAHG